MLNLPALARRLSLSSSAILFVSAQSQGKAYSLAEQFAVPPDLLDHYVYFLGDPTHELARYLSEADLLHPIVTNPDGHRAHGWVYDHGMVQPAIVAVCVASMQPASGSRTAQDQSVSSMLSEGQTSRAVMRDQRSMAPSAMRTMQMKETALYSWAMHPSFRSGGRKPGRPKPWLVWEFVERKLDRINFAETRRVGSLLRQSSLPLPGTQIPDIRPAVSSRQRSVERFADTSGGNPATGYLLNPAASVAVSVQSAHPTASTSIETPQGKKPSSAAPISLVTPCSISSRSNAVSESVGDAATEFVTGRQYRSSSRRDEFVRPTQSFAPSSAKAADIIATSSVSDAAEVYKVPISRQTVSSVPQYSSAREHENFVGSYRSDNYHPSPTPAVSTSPQHDPSSGTGNLQEIEKDTVREKMRDNISVSERRLSENDTSRGYPSKDHSPFSVSQQTRDSLSVTSQNNVVLRNSAAASSFVVVPERPDLDSGNSAAGTTNDGTAVKACNGAEGLTQSHHDEYEDVDFGQVQRVASEVVVNGADIDMVLDGRVKKQVDSEGADMKDKSDINAPLSEARPTPNDHPNNCNPSNGFNSGEKLVGAGRCSVSETERYYEALAAGKLNSSKPAPLNIGLEAQEIAPESAGDWSYGKENLDKLESVENPSPSMTSTPEQEKSPYARPPNNLAFKNSGARRTIDHREVPGFVVGEGALSSNEVPQSAVRQLPGSPYPEMRRSPHVSELVLESDIDLGDSAPRLDDIDPVNGDTNSSQAASSSAPTSLAKSCSSRLRDEYEEIQFEVYEEYEPIVGATCGTTTTTNSATLADYSVGPTDSDRDLGENSSLIILQMEENFGHSRDFENHASGRTKPSEGEYTVDSAVDRRREDVDRDRHGRGVASPRDEQPEPAVPDDDACSSEDNPEALLSRKDTLGQRIAGRLPFVSSRHGAGAASSEFDEEKKEDAGGGRLVRLLSSGMSISSSKKSSKAAGASSSKRPWSKTPGTKFDSADDAARIAKGNGPRNMHNLPLEPNIHDQPLAVSMSSGKSISNRVTRFLGARSDGYGGRNPKDGHNLGVLSRERRLEMPDAPTLRTTDYVGERKIRRPENDPKSDFLAQDCGTAAAQDNDASKFTSGIAITSQRASAVRREHEGYRETNLNGFGGSGGGFSADQKTEYLMMKASNGTSSSKTDVSHIDASAGTMAVNQAVAGKDGSGRLSRMLFAGEVSRVPAGQKLSTCQIDTPAVKIPTHRSEPVAQADNNSRLDHAPTKDDFRTWSVTRPDASRPEDRGTEEHFARSALLVNVTENTADGTTALPMTNSAAESDVCGSSIVADGDGATFRNRVAGANGATTVTATKNHHHAKAAENPSDSTSLDRAEADDGILGGASLTDEGLHHHLLSASELGVSAGALGLGNRTRARPLRSMKLSLANPDAGMDLTAGAVNRGPQRGLKAVSPGQREDGEHGADNPHVLVVPSDDESSRVARKNTLTRKVFKGAGNRFPNNKRSGKSNFRSFDGLEGQSAEPPRQDTANGQLARMDSLVPKLENKLISRGSVHGFRRRRGVPTDDDPSVDAASAPQISSVGRKGPTKRYQDIRVGANDEPDAEDDSIHRASTLATRARRIFARRGPNEALLSTQDEVPNRRSVLGLLSRNK